MTEDKVASPLNRLSIFAYALLGIPAATCLPVFYLYLIPTYLDSAPASVALLAIGLGSVRLLDTAIPLLFGHWADRLALPVGRRRAGWLCGAALIIIGLAVFAWFAEEIGIAHLLAGGSALTIGSAIMRVSQLAWAAELTGNYHQRSRFYFAAQVAATLGILTGLTLPYLATNLAAFHLGIEGIILGTTTAICAVAGIMMLIHLPDPVAEPAPERVLPSFKRVNISPSWRRVLIAHSLNVFANSLPAILLVYISLDIIGSRAIILPTVGTYLAAALFGLPLGLALARRCGKHQSWSAALIFTSAVMIWIPLLGPGDSIVLLILAALIGFTAGMDWALPAAIQADTVDTESLRSDKVRAGFQFGLWLFASRCAMGLALIMTLGLIGLTSGIAAIQPGTAGKASELILVLAGLLPALAKLMAVTQIWNLPLDATKHKAIQDRLKARRQESLDRHLSTQA